MSLTNKVLYDIDQRNDTTLTQKETARKNIGAYEDKTAAGAIDILLGSCKLTRNSP